MHKIALLVVALLVTGCDGTDSSVVKKWGGTVRLVLDPPFPSAGSVPDHILVNETKETIGYGHAFGLEQRSGDRWRPVQSRCGFTAEGLSLNPGESSSPAPVRCRDHDPPLESGVYRLTKEVDVWLGDDEGYDVETLVLTFKVV